MNHGLSWPDRSEARRVLTQQNTVNEDMLAKDPNPPFCTYPGLEQLQEMLCGEPQGGSIRWGWIQILEIFQSASLNSRGKQAMSSY